MTKAAITATRNLTAAASARVRLWRDSTLLIDSNTRATLGTSTSGAPTATDSGGRVWIGV